MARVVIAWQHQTTMCWCAAAWLCFIIGCFSYIQGPFSAQATRPAVRRKLEVKRCTLNATTYHPSKHELAWTENVAVWAHVSINESTYCATMAPMIADAQLWLPRLNTMMAPGHFSMSLDAEQSKHFSHFTYSYDCGGAHRLHQRVPIEPLVGGLRHPFFPCDVARSSGDGSGGAGVVRGVHYLGRKDCLLLASAAVAPYRHSSHGKVFIFDLGAVLYDTGGRRQGVGKVWVQLVRCAA